MASKRPMPGPGCYQWNTVAWFGAQLGCTGWIVIGAALLTRDAPELAVVWLLGFLAANGIGCWLWMGRRRLRPFPAMQMGLLGWGISGLAALVALHWLRPGLEVSRPAGIHLRDEVWLAPAFLILLLTLMGYTSVLEWGARKERARRKRSA
jgi:hypothetical protein